MCLCNILCQVGRAVDRTASAWLMQRQQQRWRTQKKQHKQHQQQQQQQQERTPCCGALCGKVISVLALLFLLLNVLILIGPPPPHATSTITTTTTGGGGGGDGDGSRRSRSVRRASSGGSASEAMERPAHGNAIMTPLADARANAEGSGAHVQRQKHARTGLAQPACENAFSGGRYRSLETMRARREEVAQALHSETAKASIMFVHMRKGGGQTLREMFRIVTEEHPNLNFTTIEGPAAQEHWFRERALILMNMRHPVERFLSEYDYEGRDVKESGQLNHRLEDVKPGQTTRTIEEYIYHVEQKWKRMKAQAQLWRGMWFWKGPGNYYVRRLTMLFRSHLDWRRDPTREDLQVAKDFVDSVGVLLLTELFDTPEQTEYLEQAVGGGAYKLPRGIHRNRRPRRTDVSDTTLATLRKWYDLDIELYEHAKSTLACRWEEMRQWTVSRSPAQEPEPNPGQ